MDNLGLFSRRHMLAGLGGVAAASAVGAQSAGATTGGSLATGTYNDWRARVGSNFTASTGHVLRLVEVQAYARYGTPPPGVRFPGFLARFDILRGGGLKEGRYRVAHPTGGTFDIYLTKGGPDKPLRMLAVFN